MVIKCSKLMAVNDLWSHSTSSPACNSRLHLEWWCGWSPQCGHQPRSPQLTCLPTKAKGNPPAYPPTTTTPMLHTLLLPLLPRCIPSDYKDGGPGGGGGSDLVPLNTLVKDPHITNDYKCGTVNS